MRMKGEEKGRRNKRRKKRVYKKGQEFGRIKES